MLLLVRDATLRRRLTTLGVERGLRIVEPRTAENMGETGQPTVIVAELELPGVAEAIAEWKRRWPNCFVAATITIPNQELWIGAQAAGADLVANKGAFPRALGRHLAELGRGGQLVKRRTRLRAKPVENPGDGLVGRLPDAPDGSIAVFRLGDRLCAFRDICPHAGVSLADGKLEGRVITCPGHGSQFDVCTGDRQRGPADFPIQTYAVVLEGEDIYVET